MTKVKTTTLKRKEEEDADLFVSTPADLDDGYVGSEGDSGSDDERAHRNLMSDIGKISTKKKLGGAPRSVRFSIKEGGTRVNTEDILKRIGSKDLEKVTSKITTLSTPLEKVTVKRVKRATGYEKVSCEAEKWSTLVHNRRVDDQLSFPLQQADVRVHTALKVEEIKAHTPLEEEVYALLQGAKLIKDNKETNEEIARKKAMSLEELKERNRLAWKQKMERRRIERKAWMQNKNKSRKFHRLLRRDRLKKEKAELEELEKKDPEAALEKLEELEKVRVHERMTLRHKKSKWAHLQGMRATRDEQAMAALKENQILHQDLVAKRKRQDSSSEDEEEESEEKLREKLEELRKERQNAKEAGLFDPSNPWTANLIRQVPERAKMTPESAIDDSFVNFKKFWDEVNRRKIIERKAQEEAEKRQQEAEGRKENEEDDDGEEDDDREESEEETVPETKEMELEVDSEKENEADDSDEDDDGGSDSAKDSETESRQLKDKSNLTKESAEEGENQPSLKAKKKKVKVVKKKLKDASNLAEKGEEGDQPSPEAKKKVKLVKKKKPIKVTKVVTKKKKTVKIAKNVAKKKKVVKAEKITKDLEDIPDEDDESENAQTEDEVGDKVKGKKVIKSKKKVNKVKKKAVKKESEDNGEENDEENMEAKANLVKSNKKIKGKKKVGDEGKVGKKLKTKTIKSKKEKQGSEGATTKKKRKQEDVEDSGSSEENKGKKLKTKKKNSANTSDVKEENASVDCEKKGKKKTVGKKTEVNKQKKIKKKGELVSEEKQKKTEATEKGKKVVKKGKAEKQRKRKEKKSDSDETEAETELVEDIEDLEDQLVSIDNMFSQAELGLQRKLKRKLEKLGINASEKKGWTTVKTKKQMKKDRGILPKIEEFDFTAKKNEDNIDEGLEQARTLEDMDQLQKKTENEDALQKAVKTLKSGDKSEDSLGGDAKTDEKEVPKVALVDPSKFLQVDTKVLKGAMPDSIMKGDENALDDEEDEDDDADDILREAFADDYLVDEFRAEKEEAIEKDKPKDISLVLPGWGDWTGPNMKVSERKRRKFMIRAPPAPPRKDSTMGNVIYNEKADVHDNLRKAMVSELPYPFSRVQDFEASIRAPVGRLFVPEIEHRKLTAPPIVTKIGRVIEPMTEEELLKHQRDDKKGNKKHYRNKKFNKGNKRKFTNKKNDSNNNSDKK